MHKVIHFFTSGNQREPALVLAQVLKKFLTAAANSTYKTNVIYAQPGSEKGSINEAFVLIEGEQIESFLSTWIGTIRWVGQSKFSKIEKETSWYVGIRTWNQEVSFDFKASDVSFQTMRSGGPGGQHVNKVSTAVRATHVPSGIQVSASDSRSQSKNKELALQRLKDKVATHQMTQLVQALKTTHQAPGVLHENHPIKTFRGTDFKKESTKKPIKKERQTAKVEIKKRRYELDD